MKNIIIKEDWLKILEEESKELRDTVMDAIYTFAIHGRDPENLDKAASLAYKLIKSEIISMNEEYDFDGAREAAIRKKRLQEKRASRFAGKSPAGSSAPTSAQAKVTVEKHRVLNKRSLPNSGNVPFVSLSSNPFFSSFKEFYDLYPARKDDIQKEFSRLKYHFPMIKEEIKTFAPKLREQMEICSQLESDKITFAPFPSMSEWIAEQCWNDKIIVTRGTLTD